MKFWKSKGFLSVLLFFPIIAPFCARSTTVEPTLHQVRIEELSNPILAFDIASGSDLAAAALSDLRVRLWRLSSGQLVREFSFPEPPTDQNLKLDNEYEPVSLHFSPDGKTLAVGFLNAIHLYNVETWNEEKTLSVAGEDKVRPDIKVTPATPQLTRRSVEEANAEKTTPIPNINQTMRRWAAQRHQGDGRTRIRDFTFTKDGLFVLASYCRGGCWSSSGAVVAYPSGTDPVRLWDLRAAKIVWEKLYDPQGIISRVVLLPDGGRFLAVNSELAHCAVGAYDLATGQVLWSHPFGPCLTPPGIAMLSDGESFITNRVDEANRDNRKEKIWRHAAIYETSTGKKISDLPVADGISAADISSEGRWLVSIIWRGTQFQIWDIQAKRIVLKGLPKGWKRTADCVLNRVRFSPDNHWLVVGCSTRGDMAVYQWGEERGTRP
jgi:WD40 repeat protein